MLEGEQRSNILFSPDGGRTYVNSRERGGEVAAIVEYGDLERVRTVADALKEEFGWDYTKHEELMCHIPADIPKHRNREFGRALNKVWQAGLIPHAEKSMSISSISSELSKYNTQTDDNRCERMSHVYYLVTITDNRWRITNTHAVLVPKKSLTFAEILSTLALNIATLNSQTCMLLKGGHCLSPSLSFHEYFMLAEMFGFNFSSIHVDYSGFNGLSWFIVKLSNRKGREISAKAFQVSFPCGDLCPLSERWISTVGKNYVKKMFTGECKLSQLEIYSARRRLELCIDYLCRAGSLKIRQIQKISVPDMVARHDKWVRAKNKKLAKEKKEKIKRLMQQITSHDHEATCYWFNDGSRIIKLIDYDDFMIEGQLMKHCVESYFEDYDGVGGFDGVYSLRGPDGMPTATAEISLLNADFPNKESLPDEFFVYRFEQIQAKNNGDPTLEDVEKFSRFLEFLNAVKLTSKEVKRENV